MPRVRKPTLILVFAAVMLFLLPLLAWLQYQWLGKVSEGERQQMQASLRLSADEFRDNFDRQISAVYSSFQPRPPLPGHDSGGLRRVVLPLDGWPPRIPGSSTKYCSRKLLMANLELND